MKNETVESAVEVGALVIYDNVRAGKCAKELCDRLQKHLGSECELNLNVGNLAALQIPDLARTAAEASTRPCLLILAVNGNESLPSFARNWISQYVGKTHGAGSAIVALFHGIIRMGLVFAPAYDDLKQIAGKAGVDFFPGVLELADSDFADCMNEIHERACMRPAVLDAILNLHLVPDPKSP